ncbi:MAG: hypothetical protein P1P69_04110 [Methanosarcinaceae archaeon]|nr:hypothetical protein [Methanosarcinaceae archaeon]
MSIFDTIKTIWQEYRTPVRIAPPTAQPTTTSTIVMTPPSLRTPTQTHSTTPTVHIHDKEPDEKKDVRVVRDPRTFAETKQALANLEGSVAERIPTFEKIVDKSVTLAEKSPVVTQKLIEMREVLTATPRGQMATDITEAFGSSVYREIQTKPLQTAAWIGVGMGSGAALRGVGSAVGLSGRLLYGGVREVKYVKPLIQPMGTALMKTSRGLEQLLKVKHFGTAVDVGMTGLFGYSEYNRATQPVFSGEYDYKTDGDQTVGTPIMRKPTYAEMAGRLGSGAVVGAAVLVGAGIVRYNTIGSIKNTFKTKPQTAAEVAEESERLYSVVRGYKITEKTQPYTFAGDSTKRSIKIITEEVPESLISSVERRKFEDVVKHQQARDLISSLKTTITEPSGKMKTVDEIKKITLIKKYPEPTDVLKNVQQMTLGDMSVSIVGKGNVKVQYGGVSKDVFRRGSDDWNVLVADTDKFTRWSNVVGFSGSKFETPTTLKYIRGRVLGSIADTKAAESTVSTVKISVPNIDPIRYDKYGKIIKSKYNLLESAPLSRRSFDIRVKQTGIDDFFRAKVSQTPLTQNERIFGHGRKEAAISLTGKSLKAIENIKPIATAMPRTINGKMKGFMIKRDEPLIRNLGKLKNDGIGASKQPQTHEIIEDIITKPKSDDIVAEQIINVIEPKHTGTQSSGLLPKTKFKPSSRTGSVFGAPSAQSLSNTQFNQVLGVVDTVAPTKYTRVAPIFNVSPIQAVSPIPQIKRTEQLAPFAIMGSRLKPSTIFKPAQVKKIAYTPTTSFKPLMDTKQVIDSVVIQEPVSTLRPKKLDYLPLKPRGKPFIPVLPLLLKLPKKDKKKDKKQKTKMFKGFQYYIENPIASPFGTSIGKVKK